jgi:hypothetical protein
MVHKAVGLKPIKICLPPVVIITICMLNGKHTGITLCRFSICILTLQLHHIIQHNQSLDIKGSLFS